LFLLALCCSATVALGQDSDSGASANDSDKVESATGNAPVQPVAADAPSLPIAADAPSQPVAASSVKLKHPDKYNVDRIGDRGIGKGINFFSLNRERAIGENMSRNLESHMHLIGDPDLNAYVNRIVQNLVIHSDAQAPFTVKIVKNDEINAFSLPGGFLYVNSGLIAACPDEATFAGILAHEVAHVAARHATKNLTRRMMFRMATLPFMFLTGGAAVAAGNAVALALPMSNMKFNRDSEREADLLALEYAYAAGYDPAAFVQFFETLQTRQYFKIPKLMAMMLTSHLMNDERIKRAQAEIATMLPEKAYYVIDTSDFRQAKARLFQVVQQPCTDASGMPILLGAGQRQHCSDPDSDTRPKLRRKKTAP
jgi:predicted Zn-dependent protease